MLKKVLLLIVIISSTSSILAQDRLITKANEKYEEYSFSPAIDIYKKVLEKGFVSSDLLKKLGNSYYFNANYPEASKVYKRLVDEYVADVSAEDYFRYAQTLRTLEQYDDSKAIMAKFTELTTNDNRASAFQKERDYMAEITENSGRYEIENFKYNSIYSEFAPTYYKQGILFSSDRDTGNLAKYRHTWNSKDFLDLYKVDADSTSFNTVIKLDKNLNTKLHESTSASTMDGDVVYFTRNNMKDGKYVKDENDVIRLKIFKAVSENGLWVSIEDLPFNSDLYSTAHPALSPDGRTLYFASDMTGSYGQSDIFKVSINQDGTYGTPENLGDNINTEARETFPFVSANEILYFASDGHPGLGGLDVFATKIKNWTYNGVIFNVGKPINSRMDDFTFIVDEESKNGYFASNRTEGVGEDDIYTFTEIKPLAFDCIQRISGTVRDKISSEPLVGATIKIIDENNEEILSTITDANGNYKIEINCNQGNFVRALMQGYVPSEEYLGRSEGKPFSIDFYLERDRVVAGFGDDLAKLLQLSTIYFDLNKFDIRKDAEIEIQKVIAAMEKYPSLNIQVNSHTDSRGKDSYNLWLSQKRAQSTVTYMISKGLSKERLTGKGYGETRLMNGCDNASSCTSKEHQLNRRSEFIILE